MSSTAPSTPIHFTPFTLPMFYLHGKHQGDPARIVLGEQGAANLKPPSSEVANTLPMEADKPETPARPHDSSVLMHHNMTRQGASLFWI